MLDTRGNISQIALIAIFMIGLHGCEKQDVNVIKKAAVDVLQEPDRDRVVKKFEDALSSKIRVEPIVRGDLTGLRFSVTNGSPYEIRRLYIAYDIYSAGQRIRSDDGVWTYTLRPDASADLAVGALDQSDPEFHKLKTAVNYSVVVTAKQPYEIKTGTKIFNLYGKPISFNEIKLFAAEGLSELAGAKEQNSVSASGGLYNDAAKNAAGAAVDAAKAAARAGADASTDSAKDTVKKP